jgi:polar amino acid transport system substrate-binding protein
VPDLVSDLAPTGVLRASINLGNPVLAQGSPDAPSGVTVDIARELGRRLGVEVRLTTYDAARKSYAAMVAGEADVCFLAIEPARERDVAFTAPYVVIEGVYVVAADSDLTTPGDVDRDGVRIGVNEGSAYDLYLSRTLERAELVRADSGFAAFRELGLEAAAGIREPMSAAVATVPGLRVIDEPFTDIRQALGTTLDRATDTQRFLASTIEELKANGFVRDALRRSGQAETLVAPAAG